MKTKDKAIKSLNLYLTDFLKAIPAGVSISFGGVAYLACENKIVGALFFALGLFLILMFNFNLFTGKVCYLFEKRPNYILNLCCIWLGNFVGALATGLFVRLTRLFNLTEKCLSLVNTKLNDSLLSIFILAIFCNILIFVAVHGFNNFKTELLRVLALFFGVSVFVLCGFEHCVANMFYFTFAGVWNAKSIMCLFVTTAGNICGGLIAYFAMRACTSKANLNAKAEERGIQIKNDDKSPTNEK